MTEAALVHQLTDVGLAPGRNVLVHCSLRAVGGSAEAVYGALRAVVGDAASIVVPTHTAINSATSSAYRDATRHLDAAGLADYEARRPGFDPARTPSHGMGQLAEYVRRHPAAHRSTHPLTSFAAVGPTAAELVGRHDLDCHLGEESPLGALYQAGASVLLLGVGYDVCTALHLAEYRLPWPPPPQDYRCYVDRDGQREETKFRGVRLDAGDFMMLGADLEARTAIAHHGPFGAGTARALDLCAAVDFAVAWMTERRGPPLGHSAG
jgi:aminoglycoside 3-N-acetyltransferase